MKGLNLGEIESPRCLGDQLLNVEHHGFDFLKTMLLPGIILYFSLSPQTAAVFIIEYFKVDPTIALLVIQVACPILIGIAIARMLFIYWFTIFGYIFALLIAGLILGIIIPIYFILRRTHVKWAERYYKSLLTTSEKLSEKLRVKDKKERQILLSNKILAVILALGLLVAQFFDNPVGHRWNPDYNHKLELVANLHYYCQLTGTYNKEECDKWKARKTRI